MSEPPPPFPGLRPRVVGAISVGGAVGALGRAGVAAWMGTGTGWPWPTITVNLLGSLLLGVLTGLAIRRAVDAVLFAGLGAGLLGGFTTFSTFSVEVVERWRHGSPALALAVVAVSLVGGVVAAWLGLVVGDRIGGRTEAPIP